VLAEDPVNLTCHVLRNVDFTFLITRDDHRDLRVEREAQNLFLMEQFLAAVTERLNLGDAVLRDRRPHSDCFIGRDTHDMLSLVFD